MHLIRLHGMHCRRKNAGSIMNEELEYLPLSWLSQAAYCLRRAALLLNERVWMENADTAKGRAEHERVHTQRIERRGEEVKLYEQRVFSDRLLISGRCDCIEATFAREGCRLPTIDFPVALFPVEYKHGSVRNEQAYNIQLCGEAICLEEMYHTKISSGAIFYITAHKRNQISLDAALRQKVEETAQALHQIRHTLTVPPAEYGGKCKRCSLQEYCMPGSKRNAGEYCAKLAQEAQKVVTQ